MKGASGIYIHTYIHTCNENIYIYIYIITLHYGNDLKGASVISMYAIVTST